MPIIMFILLCVGLAYPAGAVEVYSGGRHFDSFEDYQKINQKPSGMPLTTVAVPIPPAKPKIPALSADEQRMDKMSYNHGVSHVVVGFEQSWENSKPRFIVGTKELEHVIEETMKKQHEPALLVSDPQKLRILTYYPKKDALSEERVDKTGE
jgi:hypothetical protein